jgi:hypothetical protein
MEGHSLEEEDVGCNGRVIVYSIGFSFSLILKAIDWN